jgi:hypothetical protein
VSPFIYACFLRSLKLTASGDLQAANNERDADVASVEPLPHSPFPFFFTSDAFFFGAGFLPDSTDYFLRKRKYLFHCKTYTFNTIQNSHTHNHDLLFLLFYSVYGNHRWNR